jgi:hypothetical protein
VEEVKRRARHSQRQCLTCCSDLLHHCAAWPRRPRAELPARRRSSTNKGFACDSYQFRAIQGNAKQFTALTGSLSGLRLGPRLPALGRPSVQSKLLVHSPRLPLNSNWGPMERVGPWNGPDRCSFLVWTRMSQPSEDHFGPMKAARLLPCQCLMPEAHSSLRKRGPNIKEAWSPVIFPCLSARSQSVLFACTANQLRSRAIKSHSAFR